MQTSTVSEPRITNASGRDDSSINAVENWGRARARTPVDRPHASSSTTGDLPRPQRARANRTNSRRSGDDRFRELCDTGRTIELEHLRRFTNVWEAAASLVRRNCNPFVLGHDPERLTGFARAARCGLEPVEAARLGRTPTLEAPISTVRRNVGNHLRRHMRSVCWRSSGSVHVVRRCDRIIALVQ